MSMQVLISPIAEKVQHLKAERNAVILAHNYQLPEVQEISDFTGDSLGLAQQATATEAEVIVFCGVHFMAETASILCPEKKVLLPDLEAGCSLASMITAEDLRAWKAQHPNAVVVCYVNSSAAVKAESDYCCTSSNAVKVIEAIPTDREILFVPDMYLGQYLRDKTGRDITLWPGYCGVHVQIRPERITQLRQEHPGAEFLVHPECGCSTAVLPMADKYVSTEGMVRWPAHSSAKEFIIATETGILHRLRKQYPDRVFYPASEDAVCGFMKKITLEKVLWSLEDLQYEVTVAPEIASKARRAIDRMLELV